MARINPDFYQQALTQKGVREMDFTGRPMKGFLFISPEGVMVDSDLEYWIEQCLDFNLPKHDPVGKNKSSHVRKSLLLTNG